MSFKEVIKKRFWISLEERFTAQCNQIHVSTSGGSATDILWHIYHFSTANLLHDLIDKAANNL